MPVQLFVPRVASLLDLRTYNRKSFGVTVTEAEELEERHDSSAPGSCRFLSRGAGGPDVRIYETSNPKHKEQIDTVGWVFAAFVILMTAIAAVSLAAVHVRRSTGWTGGVHTIGSELARTF
jgi:hypothetical protein